MFSKKNLSILIAVVILCACVAGAFLLGTHASAAAHEWTVNSGVPVTTAGDNKNFHSIKDALDYARTESESGAYGARDTLTIVLKENAEATVGTSGGATQALIFEQTTIWRTAGNKLPIIIEGDSSSYTLSIPTGSVDCANDYTFRNLTLPWSENASATYFYAGSGNIKFENVTFGSGTNLYLRADSQIGNVFAGWTEAAFSETNSLGEPATTTSITFGENAFFETADKINCKSSAQEWSRKISDNLTIRPRNTKVGVIAGPGSRVGRIRMCAVNTNSDTKRADEMFLDVQPTAKINGIFGVYSTYTVWGNMSIKVSGNITSTGGRGYVCPLMNGATLKGNLSVELSGITLDPSAAGSGNQAYFRMASSTGSATTLDGDATLVVKDEGALFSSADYPFFGFGTNTSCTGTFTTTIQSGTFHSYAPSAGGTLNNVVNNISGGFFYGKIYGGVNQDGSGSGSVTGKITNNISGGATTFFDQFIAGSYDGSVGSLENNVSGATFESNYFGGNYNGGTIAGTAVNNISGGTFQVPAYIASRKGTVTGAVTNTISGGTFEKQVYLSGNNAVLTTGATNLVTGGTFMDELVDGAANRTVTTSLTIRPNASDLTVYGTVTGCDVFDGNGATVNLGKEANIEVGFAGGSVTFSQTELWLSHVYFTASSGSIAITAAKASSAITGTASVEGNTLTGTTETLAGVTFVFKEYVQLRFAFFKDVVDSVDSSYYFTARVCGHTIANATYAQLKAGTVSSDGNYYLLLSDPIYAAGLSQLLVYEGSMTPTSSISLLDLADRGIAAYAGQEELVALLKAYSNYAISVRNYLVAQEGGDPIALRYPEATPTAPDFTPSVGPLTWMSTPIANFVARKLILDTGVHVRYYGTTSSASNLSNLKVYVNGREDVGALEYHSGETYTLTLEIPVPVSESGTMLRITIKDTTVDTSTDPFANVVFDFVERIDRLAYETTNLPGAEELGNETLNYLQNAVNWQATYLAAAAYQNANVTLPDSFSAGYGSADISPYGYSVTISEDATGKEVKETLYTTCLAIGDGNTDHTALFFSVPARKIPTAMVAAARERIHAVTGVPEENIIFNATHCHSSPNITATSSSDVRKWYNDYLYPGLTNAAIDALIDLQPVSAAYKGTANSVDGTGYVRRYFDSEGKFRTIQASTYTYYDPAQANTYESTADKELRTIRFVRGGTDILMVNWQGHAASAASVLTNKETKNAFFSADFLYYLQKGVEETMGMHCAYFNGGSGDINFSAQFGETNPLTLNSSPYYSDYLYQAVGKSLVATAQSAESSHSAISLGDISMETFDQTVTIRKDSASRVDNARLLNAVAIEDRSSYLPAYGFHSALDVTHTITRNDKRTNAQDELPISVVSFGDVFMSFTSYEMFHQSASAIRAAALSHGYASAFVCGYTDGDDGYMPTSLAFTHGGYEMYACYYTQGTAEDCVSAITARM